MNSLFRIGLTLALLSPFAYAGKKEEAEAKAKEAQLQLTLDNLRREVDALRKIKAEKLDRIESMETQRWEARYRLNQSVQEHQELTRSLEGKYTKSSTDLGRLNEELVQSRNATEEAKVQSENAKQSLAGFNLQLQQAIEKAANELSNDYPIGLEARTASLDGARAALEGKAPRAEKGLDLYLETLLSRYSLTLDQEFEQRTSQLGSMAEVPVYRLRLGTIFLGEAAREGEAVQALQRTGALQGRVFEWRADLNADYRAGLRSAVLDAHKGQKASWIPIDVLQNKSSQGSTRNTQESTTWGDFKAFVKAGGPVMYPLGLVAFLALLLSLERFIYFVRKGRVSKKFIAELNKKVEAQEYEAAYQLAKAQNNSMGNALAAILLNVKTCSRTGAEKALREVLLREQPLLERRMGLIGALGGSAPLLGLLGTVTGMISLFKIITEVGTNDAKVLAGGIAEALITTETGLIIAIPVLLLHGWLTERLDIITSSLGIQSMSLLNKLWPEAEQGK